MIRGNRQGHEVLRFQFDIASKHFHAQHGGADWLRLRLGGSPHRYRKFFWFTSVYRSLSSLNTVDFG